MEVAELPKKGSKTDYTQEIVDKRDSILQSSVSKWGISVPGFKDCLTKLVANSKAGRISHFYPAWTVIASDKEILSDIKGMTIELSDMPLQHHFTQTKFTSAETEITTSEVGGMQNKGIIEEVTHESDEILSSIFTRSKKDGTHRVILNLKEFNERVSYYHIKMDSLSTITKLVKKNCFMASIDLKDAYYSIPIKYTDRKYLKFQWNGRLYQFTCLPNGLSSGPRKFTKILKPPLALLHTKGHIISGHLDDFYLQGQTFDE